MRQGAVTAHSGTIQNTFGSLPHVTERRKQRGREGKREGGSDAHWVSFSTCHTEDAEEMLAKEERGRGRETKQEDDCNWAPLSLRELLFWGEEGRAALWSRKIF